MCVCECVWERLGRGVEEACLNSRNSRDLRCSIVVIYGFCCFAVYYHGRFVWFLVAIVMCLVVVVVVVANTSRDKRNKL